MTGDLITRVDRYLSDHGLADTPDNWYAVLVALMVVDRTQVNA